MKYLTLILLLSGCSLTNGLDTIATKGAEVNDKAINRAIWLLCKGVSVGASDRKFNTEELENAKDVICKHAEH